MHFVSLRPILYTLFRSHLCVAHKNQRPEARSGLQSYELPPAEDVFDTLLHKQVVG